MNTTLNKTLLCLATAAASGSAFSQVQLPTFSVEGKVSAISDTSITCAGVTARMDAQTNITSPTKRISIADANSPTPWPGLTDASEPGMKGTGAALVAMRASCIVDGIQESATVGPDTVPPLYARNVFVEVAENVLVGPRTGQVNGQFEIMGIKVVLLKDPPAAAPGYTPVLEGYRKDTANPVRIEATVPVNGGGFPVRLETVPLGDLSSAEGHLVEEGSTKTFYAFAVETTGGDVDGVTNGPLPDATVQRGDATLNSNGSYKLEIRGACSLGTSTSPMPLYVAIDRGTVDGKPRWWNASTNTEMTSTSQPNASCAADPATPGFGTYRYRVDRYNAGGFAPTVASVRIQSQPTFDPGVPLTVR